MLVDVHLHKLQLALGSTDDLFQDRRELFAGPTPRRPKIDELRLSSRLLDHVLDEGLRSGLFDRGVGRGSGVLQHRIQSLSISMGKEPEMPTNKWRCGSRMQSPRPRSMSVPAYEAEHTLTSPVHLPRQS